MEVRIDASRLAQQLFQEHGAAVYRFAIVLLRHQQDAEDVAQETFLKLVRHLGAGGDTTNIRGWLFTVAAHAARDRQRWRARWIPWAPSHDGSSHRPRFPTKTDACGAIRDALQKLRAPRSASAGAPRAGSQLSRDRQRCRHPARLRWDGCSPGQSTGGSRRASSLRRSE